MRMFRPARFALKAFGLSGVRRPFGLAASLFGGHH
jgi:hypothetical protein